MAKNIKDKLWAQHMDMIIPELTEEKINNSFSRLEQVKLTNPEKHSQLVHGIVVSCEAAWKKHLEQNQTLTNESIVVDASSLWKVCTNRKDIYKLANSLQYHVHCAMPEVYAKVSVTCTEITVQLIDKATMKPPFVEQWLTDKVNQRHTELTFTKLESFYKAQPAWEQRQYNFIDFVKILFNRVKQTIKHLLSFKIDRQEKKVILLYS